MKSDRKRTILFIIILLVLSLGIGYAFLTTTLSIDGVSDIDSAVWDIHWENVQVQSESVSGSKVISPATIGNNGNSISFHVKLAKPGDNYSFIVEAVNDGTLDAQIDDVEIKVNGVENDFPSYIQFVNGNLFGEQVPLDVGQPLYYGVSLPYWFSLRYKDDVTASELPAEDTTLNITINITYTQLKSNTSFNNNYLYTSDSSLLFLKDHYLPTAGDYYDSYNVPLSNFSNYNFLRFGIQNNKVSSTEVGIYMNDTINYLKGGDGGVSYNANKATLNAAFGEDKCSESSYLLDCDDYPNCDTKYNYYCHYASYVAEVNNFGEVNTRISIYKCFISDQGAAYCYKMSGL